MHDDDTKSRTFIREEYDKEHIPLAIFYNHELVSDLSQQTPQAFPKLTDFVRYMNKVRFQLKMMLSFMALTILVSVQSIVLLYSNTLDMWGRCVSFKVGSKSGKSWDIVRKSLVKISV